MIRPNTYSAFAYETGFAHALAGIERPIKGQCDSLYLAGYNAAINQTKGV